MKRELAKKLLENGVLQAYANGETIQIKDPGISQYGWTSWSLDSKLNFDSDILEYRVKSKLIPHDFQSACKAIGEHGANIRDEQGNNFTICRVSQASCDVQPRTELLSVTYWYDSMMGWTFLDGTPFHKEEE